ncbi:MAG: ABC transporter permease [Chloroflexi bacterium]|nr:ABC transporter permease [Chloroflexota bacterium]
MRGADVTTEAALSTVSAGRVGGRPGWPVLRFVQRNALACLGMLIVGLFFVVALLGTAIAPYDPLKPDVAHSLEAPSAAHLLGTDDLGRDVLSRLAAGTTVSLQVSLVSVGVATIVGLAVGLVCGYWGGWIDDIIMRLMDALYAFPTLILAIALVGALGPSLINAMLAISIVALPRFARLVRAQVLSVREREYIQAARVSGAGSTRILVRHICPNVISIVVIQAALTTAFAILTESNLSFLGLGVRPPTPSLGSMLRLGYPFIEMAPWLAITPGAVITLAVLGFSLLGDGIRDLLDPRLRNR